MTYVIGEACVDVKDRACVEECPVDCIYEGDRTLYINPEECVDCGACEPVCPVQAIYYEDDLPESDQPFYDIAVKFFEQVGNLGGASRVGPLGQDEPRVSALPPKAE
jgi:NAD-dependent dihydropyrimidine dehydrogenase PreA subunit